VLARLLSAFVALAVIFGAVQVAELHAPSVAPVAAAEMDVAAAPIDMELNVPVIPIVTRVPLRQLVPIEMPSLDGFVVTALAPRTFRPPRS